MDVLTPGRLRSALEIHSHWRFPAWPSASASRALAPGGCRLTRTPFSEPSVTRPPLSFPRLSLVWIFLSRHLSPSSSRDREAPSRGDRAARTVVRVCDRGAWPGRLRGGAPFSPLLFFCSHWQPQVVGTEAPEPGSGCPSLQMAGPGSTGRADGGSDRCSSAALGGLWVGKRQPLKSAAMPLAKCLCEPFYAGFFVVSFKNQN